MDKIERIIDLKKENAFIEAYVSLRNRYTDLLLTKTVDTAETEEWLKREDIEIRAILWGTDLVGAVILYLHRDGEIAFFAKDQNRGIGTKLLKVIEVVAKGKNLKSIWAWALYDNLAAQKTFQKNGYIFVRRLSKPYKNGERPGVIFRKEIGSKMNIMKNDKKNVHRQKVYGIRPKAQEFPMMCVLSFSYVCNAKCLNCPYTNSQIRIEYQDRPFMEETTFKLIADECGQHGAWIRISGGGEPMLHPKAVELMEYAKNVGAKVGLITNGSLFSDESSSRLIKAQVDMIEFSVDASDPGTYSNVRKGLKWGILLDNVTRMVEIRNRLKGSTKIIASAVNQVDVDIDAVESYWELVVDNFQKRKYLTWGINDPSKSADPTPYLPQTEMIPCPFLFERLNIDSRGKVVVCGFDIAAKTNMGNIHNKSIKEIWHGEEFEYYRKMHLSRRGLEIELCKNCPDWQYRSWRHNYWRIVKNAEKKRRSRVVLLDFQEAEGCIRDV